MVEKELSRYEIEKCKIEIELKKNYYGAFVTNVLNSRQIQKVRKCESTLERLIVPKKKMSMSNKNKQPK